MITRRDDPYVWLELLLGECLKAELCCQEQEDTLVKDKTPAFLHHLLFIKLQTIQSRLPKQSHCPLCYKPVGGVLLQEMLDGAAEM